MTDPIADMLTRIRNGGLARKAEVIMPASTINERVANLLKQAGYVAAVAVKAGDKGRKNLVVGLRYIEKMPAITGSRRESKPGRRVYRRSDQWPRVLGGKGMAIVSTSAGMMTANEAKKKGLGGELLCIVW